MGKREDSEKLFYEISNIGEKWKSIGEQIKRANGCVQNFDCIRKEDIIEVEKYFSELKECINMCYNNTVIQLKEVYDKVYEIYTKES